MMTIIMTIITIITIIIIITTTTTTTAPTQCVVHTQRHLQTGASRRVYCIVR